MNINNIFSEGVVCLQKSNQALSGGLENIISIILSDSNIKSENVRILKSFEGEIFSEFLILCDNKLYSLKITFDDKNESFLNEVSFLKTNINTISLPFVESELLDFSFKIRFLITSFENVFELGDFGNDFFLEQIDLFFIAISLLNNCKVEKNSRDYLEMFFSNNNHESKLLCDKSEALTFGVEYCDFVGFMGKVKKEIESCDQLEFINGRVTCHGLMLSENVILQDGLFKFKNFNYSFNGNPLIDLAFLCVSLSLGNDNKLKIIKKYCDFFNLELKSVKKDFDNCLYIASYMFLYKNFFDLFVSKVMKDEHLDVGVSLYNITKSLKYLKKLPLYSEFKKLIEEISIGEEVDF